MTAPIEYYYQSPDQFPLGAGKLSATRIRKYRNTNRKGLPFEVQKELLRDILIFGSNSRNFYKETCNNKIDTFGDVKSPLRKRIVQKRHILLKLKRDQPEEFTSLCKEFGIEAETQKIHIALNNDELKVDQPEVFGLETEATTMVKRHSKGDVHQ